MEEERSHDDGTVNFVFLGHNLDLEYFYCPKRYKDIKHTLVNRMEDLLVNVYITNYRIIFEPHFSTKIELCTELKDFFKRQPKYIKDFFQVPLGNIVRLDKYLNPMVDGS